MINFDTISFDEKSLRILNKCIFEMVEFETSFANDTCDKEDLELYFPKHIIREDKQKCIDILEDLKEWSKDNYIHELTPLYQYVIYHIFKSYVDFKDDIEKQLEDGEKNEFEFTFEAKEKVSKKLQKWLNTRTTYEEELFADLDFLYIDEIAGQYQQGNDFLAKFLGIDIYDYLELMPKDIRKQFEGRKEIVR